MKTSMRDHNRIVADSALRRIRDLVMTMEVENSRDQNISTITARSNLAQKLLRKVRKMALMIDDVRDLDEDLKRKSGP